MNIKGGETRLYDNLFSQLSSYWGKADDKLIRQVIPETLTKLESLLNNISKSNGHVWKDNQIVFSPMHSVQYAVFLYLLSNTLYRKFGGDIRETESIYYLNKIMNSCDWFYAIALPEVFFAEHPLGSVMGKADYGNQFFFYQGCTVGGNRDKDGRLHYPVIGENVLMYSNSSVLGASAIGNNVIISAGTIIVGDNVPDNSIVFGRSPNLIIKRKDEKDIQDRQRHLWEQFHYQKAKDKNI